MKQETIKQAVLRLTKNREQIKRDILEHYNFYKRNWKKAKGYAGKGYKITNKGLKPYTFHVTKEEERKRLISRLFWIFHIDRYSNPELFKRNSRIMKGLFKEDKELLKIINYSHKKVKEVKK